MSVRRLLSLLSVCIMASATVAAAAPKASKTPPPAAPAAGSGSAAGSDVSAAPAEPEEPPPKDMNGVDENPDNAKTVGAPDTTVVVPPTTTRPTGYPIEEALRPITLPANMSELAIDPHLQFSPFEATMDLHARYGITRQVQLGLTYVLAGVYHDPFTQAQALGIHSGKAVGLDVTVLLQDWIAIKVGVPIYIDPVAVSLTIGVPIKFTFGDKFAIGGLDDLLSIKLHRFPPSFYQEVDNAVSAQQDTTSTTQSKGDLRISVYGIYQQQKNLAIIGRFGFDEQDFSGENNDNGYGGVQTFLRGGFDYSPRRWCDLGLSIGFDDLAHGGTFGPAGYVALRI
jgi:hypothetical protein